MNNSPKYTPPPARPLHHLITTGSPQRNINPRVQSSPRIPVHIPMVLQTSVQTSVQTPAQPNVQTPVQTPVQLTPNVQITPVQTPVQVQITSIQTPVKIDMNDLLGDGYFKVPKSLWEHLPKGCHIRYAKAGTESLSERFRDGGFVKSHFDTDNGEHMIMLESIIGGKKGDIGYFSIPITHAEIDTIWKKYARECFVEMYIMGNTLAAKKAREDAFINEINTLSARVTTIENILRKVVGR